MLTSIFVVGLIVNALVAWWGNSKAMQKLALLLIGGFAIGEAISTFSPDLTQFGDGLTRERIQLMLYAVTDLIGMILCFLVVIRSRARFMAPVIFGCYLGMLSLHFSVSTMTVESYYNYYAGLNFLTAVLILTSIIWGVGIGIADHRRNSMPFLPSHSVAHRHKVGHR